MTAISLTACIIAFLAVFFSLIPFRLLLPAYAIPKRQEGELRVHFLDLDGGVVIVEFADGKTLILNAGGGSFTDDNTLFRYIKGLSPASVSLAAVNSDAVHVGGMSALLETCKVDTLYYPAKGAESGAWKRFVSAAEKKECREEKLTRYTLIKDTCGAYAVCLSPYSEEEGTVYDASVVLFLSYQGVNILLAGDMSSRRAKKLAEEYTLLPEIFDSGGCRVRLDETHILSLSAYHSGSAECSEFLSLLSPELSVLLCNRNNRPQSKTLENLCAYSAKVARVDELGVTVLSVRNGTYTLTPHFVK